MRCLISLLSKAEPRGAASKKHPNNLDRLSLEDELYIRVREGFYGSTICIDHTHADYCIPSFIQHVHRFYNQSLHAYGFTECDITTFYQEDLDVDPLARDLNVVVQEDILAHEDVVGEADDED